MFIKIIIKLNLILLTFFLLNLYENRSELRNLKFELGNSIWVDDFRCHKHKGQTSEKNIIIE